jgi:hypothetical protein
MEPIGLGRATLGEQKLRHPLNNASPKLESSRVVKQGDGWLYGFTITNTKGSAQFVQVFDARDLPADTAVPLISKSVPAGDAVGFAWLPPRRFEAGLVLCNSTTQATKTIGAADCLFDAQYI